MTSRQIKTIFSCNCQSCGNQISKGEMVWYKKGYGCRCLTCGKHNESAQRSKHSSRQPKPAPAPKPFIPANIPQWPDTAFETQQEKEKSIPFERDAKTAVKCSDGVYRYEFQSVTECVQSALNYETAQNEYNKTWLNQELDSSLSGLSKWANYYTKERFLNDLQNPPSHIVDAVSQIKEHITEEIGFVAQTLRRKVRRGCEFGDEIDTDKFLARNPLLWDRTVREMADKKTIVIGCNLAISGKRKPEDLLYRGAAAVALAEVLGSRGYNVGITLFESRYYPSDKMPMYVTSVIVKEPNHSLDITSVSFAMAEIAFFRICLAIGAMRYGIGKVDSCLGHPRLLPQTDAAQVDYYIDSDVFSKEQAIEWVKKCMTKTEREVQNV